MKCLLLHAIVMTCEEIYLGLSWVVGLDAKISYARFENSFHSHPNQGSTRTSFYFIFFIFIFLRTGRPNLMLNKITSRLIPNF